MILCIDIGNTATGIGLLEDLNVIASWSLRTTESTRDDYFLKLSSLLKAGGFRASRIVSSGMCSVVPSETENARAAVEDLTGSEVVLIDGSCECGVAIKVDNPREVGGDRIANAAGAFHCYGGPVVVVDMGTATTFDYVSAEGEYRGGVIAPGLMAGAGDLWKLARMLPEVEITEPGAVIGTNTVACMQSGIYYGALGQIQGILEQMWREIGSRTRVVLTGGHARLIAGKLEFETDYDPHLTLKGIASIVRRKLGKR